MQDVDKHRGLLRFEAKEPADACIAQADDGAVRGFALDNGTLQLKLVKLEGEEEAEAWRKYRAAAQERNAREDRKRAGNSGGQGKQKRARAQQ